MVATLESIKFSPSARIKKTPIFFMTLSNIGKNDYFLVDVVHSSLTRRVSNFKAMPMLASFFANVSFRLIQNQRSRSFV